MDVQVGSAQVHSLLKDAPDKMADAAPYVCPISLNLAQSTPPRVAIWRNRSGERRIKPRTKAVSAMTRKLIIMLRGLPSLMLTSPRLVGALVLLLILIDLTVPQLRAATTD